MVRLQTMRMVRTEGGDDVLRSRIVFPPRQALPSQALPSLREPNAASKPAEANRLLRIRPVAETAPRRRRGVATRGRGAVSVALVKSPASVSNRARGLLIRTSDASVSAKAADLLRITLVAGIPVMLVTDRRDAAVFIVLTATTAVVSRASRAPAVAQLVFTGLLTVASYLIAFGGVGGPAPDSAVAHFVLPAAAAPLLLSAALRSGVVASRRSDRHGIDVALIVMTAALTIALGAAWELVELACDSFFGTEMAQGYGDTIRDLIADSAGALTGAVLAVRFWPRR
jgi:hypothetical protein